HLWNVTCIDEALNRNTSATWNFTISNTPPTVTLNTSNGTSFNTSTVVLLYNATDNVRIVSSLLIINGLANMSNQSTVQNGNISNFTLTLPDGAYNWTVNVTDNGGLNATSLTYRFLVDSNPPQITLNLPNNLSSTNSSSINFSFIVTDTLSTTLMCNLTAGEKQDLNFNVTNGTLANRTLSGFTDGLKYWNVTCIDSSYNRNISETRIVNVTVYPTISLQTANNTFFNSTNFNLSYTPTDNTNFSQCILYINGVSNISNQTTIRNGLSNNFTLTSFSEGKFDWFVACNDTFGLVNSSETRTFSVDITPPSINLFAPTNGEALTSVTNLFNYTVIDNVATNLSCNITINSVVMDSNYSLNGSLISRSITFNEGGDYYWNVTCIDNAGNRNTSDTWSFMLSFPPKVNLTSPADNFIFNYSQIVLYYNVTDVNDNIANSTLFINGMFNISNASKVSNAQINNFTLTLPDGLYNWSVSSTDTTSLVGNSTTRNFTIDSTPPAIYLNSPANATTFTWNNISFNFSVVDNLDSSLNCSLLIDGIAESSDLIVANGTSNSRTVYTVKSDGVYNYSVACFDDGYNINISQARTFTVLAPPNVTLMSPRNSSIVNSSSVSFIYLPQDAIGFTNCTLILDGIENSSSDIINPNVNNSFSVSGLNEGNHNWTVSCVDAFPDFNTFTANVSNFTVDTKKPTVYLNFPYNNTNTLRNVVFNFTATDGADSNLSCNLYIDNNLNRTNISALNGSLTSVSVTGISSGVHSWNVSCIDDALNTNFSASWIFNATLPDFYVNSSTITFNNTSPKENEANSINATIYNLANITVPNVTVQFFLGDPQTTGVQIGQNITIFDFNGTSSLVVQTNLSSSGIGYSNVFVVVDPLAGTNGRIEELNESNNIGNNTVVVSAWQFVYGFMNPDNEFVLQNNASVGLAKWQASTFTSANLYVSDYDSTIFWYNLKALGKNTLDVNTTNDFADVDTLLNMTGLTDSIVKTYTNNTGVNFSTDNFMIFQRTVNNVPVTNSINNSNFKTGILWDTTKNTNTEFDTTNKEDLVFVTKVNQNAVGAYGTYDYEIRIPAKLRNYYNTDSSKVSFYSEIN
ncbi:MAG TPA: hypothetical protein VHA12_02165, partial [Candidatus Nanoarchaeia archaeon]|nr:hypothetical protein [Candidatus Nanoarchaeia archaeon]